MLSNHQLCHERTLQTNRCILCDVLPCGEQTYLLSFGVMDEPIALLFRDALEGKARMHGVGEVNMIGAAHEKGRPRINLSSCIAQPGCAVPL